jgi:hypothetical protein
LDEYLGELENPGFRVPLNREDRDYLIVYFTINKIVDVHVVGFGGINKEWDENDSQSSKINIELSP